MQMRFYCHLSARVRGDEISELNFGRYIGTGNVIPGHETRKPAPLVYE